MKMIPLGIILMLIGGLLFMMGLEQLGPNKPPLPPGAKEFMEQTRQYERTKDSIDIQETIDTNPLITKK